MALMLFSLDCEAETFPAVAIYNFKVVLNSIVVRFEKPIAQYDPERVLIFDIKSCVWTDLEGMHLSNLPLFLKILERIKEVTSECVRNLNHKNLIPVIN